MLVSSVVLVCFDIKKERVAELFSKILIIKLKGRSEKLGGESIKPEEFKKYLNKFYELSRVERERIENSFEKVDTNDSNFIDFSEFKQSLSEFASEDPRFDETVTFLMNLVNRKKDGKLTLDEYKVLMTMSSSFEDEDEQDGADCFSEVFKTIDKDKTSTISMRELSEWFKSLNVNLSESNLAQLVFESFGEFKDSLDSANFVKWMVKMERASREE